MKRYTHIVGFTQTSNIAYFEVHEAPPGGIVAVKKDGSRADFRAHWNEAWTRSSIEQGLWIEMKDGETPDAARERVRLLDEQNEEGELDAEAQLLAAKIEARREWRHLIGHA